MYIGCRGFRRQRVKDECTRVRSPASYVPTLHLPGCMQLTISPTFQVLPSESGNQQIQDDLFEMKDVKVETMRSRGAGGQVRSAAHLCYSSYSAKLIALLARTARQQNRVGYPPHALANRRDRLDARLALAARGASRIQSLTSLSRLY